MYISMYICIYKTDHGGGSVLGFYFGICPTVIDQGHHCVCVPSLCTCVHARVCVCVRARWCVRLCVCICPRALPLSLSLSLSLFVCVRARARLYG